MKTDTQTPIAELAEKLEFASTFADNEIRREYHLAADKLLEMEALLMNLRENAIRGYVGDSERAAFRALIDVSLASQECST